MVKNLPAMQETTVQSLGWEDSLEQGMATNSSILAWRILWTEEPGGLQSWGCKESNTTELLVLLSCMYIASDLQNLVTKLIKAMQENQPD